MIWLLRVALLAGFLALTSTLSPSTVSYEYDALDRLTKVTYPSGAVIEYSYDAVGNRVGMGIVP